MKKIGFLIYPDYSVMALSVSSVFEFANGEFNRPQYQLEFISEKGGAIKTSAGLEIKTSKFKPHDFDTIIIGGGSDIENYSDELIRVVNQCSKLSRRVVSICTGAFLLASAGLLDGKRATTHWGYSKKLLERFPNIKLDDDKIFIKDGNVWTSAGVTAGIDLTLALVEEDFGSDIVKSISKKLVLYHRRGGGQSQFSTLIDMKTNSNRIETVVNYTKDNLDKIISVEDMAEKAHLSPRQFGRVFKSETGYSPSKALELMRVDAAKAYIEESNHSIDWIAHKTGFFDADRMRRAFIRNIGRPPHDIRKNFEPIN